MYNRSIRYRLYPMTLDKANLLKQCLGATRYVWNYFLAENQRMMEAYRADPSNSRPNTTFFSLGKEFTQLRRTKDWLGALPFAPIRYVLKY
ncbi:MAG: helix-turn-helix domain-containing protein, partial [Gammaproteobacteria bacterium]|nr:helix-turn-helix domain-containing protein [Gammaproteobacteria bacterium]